MKRRCKFWTLALAATLLPAGTAQATPSSTVWTNTTLDIQPYGVAHWGVDNYFTVGRTLASGGGSFPTDAGLTIGVLPFEKAKMEVGVDLLEATDDPLSFNAKLGAPEGALFAGAPAVEIGIFNVGTRRGVTDQDTLDLIVGKSFAGFGRISAETYRGNPDLLVDSRGQRENTGWMVAYDRAFHSVQGPAGKFDRFVFAADYASGDNALGGGAVGVSYYFTPDLSILVGAVWFNDQAINGKMKWTIQLDINQSWFGGR